MSPFMCGDKKGGRQAERSLVPGDLGAGDAGQEGEGATRMARAATIPAVVSA